MKVSVVALLLTLAFTNLYGQWGDNYIQLSEEITTEEINISGFDKIDISEDFQVYIKFSDEEKVEIEANDNLHGLIEVENRGRTLKITTRSYSTSNGGKRGAKEVLRAYITAKRLTEIVAEEDVAIELEDKLTSDKLSIRLNEDSTLKGHLEVKNLVVDLDEDSVLDIEGSAGSLVLDANEDSMIKGYDFVVGKLDIDLNEDSEAKLTVNGDIDLQANGDSYFYYKGDGTFTRKRLRGDSEAKAY